MTIEAGTLLHKRYRIIGVLGQGGMGSIYRAIDETLGVEVAVKENLFTTDEYARQFHVEAVTMAKLRHPNLPRVSDHFVISGQGQYLVMDYIEGEDLRQRMERLGIISEQEAIIIGAAMCDALAYLHARKPPILHRDVKPGNVKITPEGHVFLVDFGLVKEMNGSQLTATGARAMTPGYSPPEQYGSARTDARTDIYSLAATLYAALTGVIPEDGLMRLMDNIELTPIRKRNPKVSQRLAQVVEKAMSPKTDDRFQTADEFKQSLLSSNVKTLGLNGVFIVPPLPPSQENQLAKSPSEKPITAELVEASRTPTKPVRKHLGIGCWISMALSFLVLFLGAMILLYVTGGLPEIIDRFLASPTVTESSPATPLKTITPGIKTATPTVTATVTFTDTPSPTITPTRVRPTATRTPSPTNPPPPPPAPTNTKPGPGP